MLNQSGNQHPMSCSHVLFTFLPHIFEIFLCHADQCGTNALQGWTMAKLDNTQCVPTLLHGIPWHVWDPSLSPCPLIWSRSWPSRSKRSRGLPAEQVNHISRRHDSLTALYRHNSAHLVYLTPFLWPWATLSRHLSLPNLTITSILVLVTATRFIPKGLFSLSLSLSMTEIQIIANGFHFSTTLWSQKRSCVHVHK